MKGSYVLGDHVCANAHADVCVCVRTCVCQITTFDVVSRQPSALFFETGFLTRSRSMAICLGWPVASDIQLYPLSHVCLG